ncbi:MAG: B12-binding domain-containing radical SAM protein [Promethearchaeota archaeon]
MVRIDGIYYKEPVFRPPSEARSLLIQVTEGCTYHCTFCVSHLNKVFKIRKTDEIKADLDTAKRVYGSFIRRIFFLDGNAMITPFEQLLELTKYAYKIFPHLERVSLYAHGKDILAKTDSELRELSEAGLKMAYIGIETGDDDLLKKINKRETAQDIINAFAKLFKAGITPSGTIILGLAGNNEEASRKHILETAKLINKAAPHNFSEVKDKNPLWYIACLALMIPKGTQIYNDYIKGTFKPQDPMGILNEMKLLIENVDDKTQNCVFRSNHASNYLAIKGVLSKDKKKILKLIDENIRTGRNIRPEYFRAL